MFKLSTSDSYKYPVVVEIVDESGRTTKHTFEAHFKRLPQSEIDRLLVASKDDGIRDEDVVDQVLIGWSGVVDEQGDAMPFNAENVRVVLDICPVRACVVRAWVDSLTGGRRKN